MIRPILLLYAYSSILRTLFTKVCPLIFCLSFCVTDAAAQCSSFDVQIPSLTSEVVSSGPLIVKDTFPGSRRFQKLKHNVIKDSSGVNSVVLMETVSPVFNFLTLDSWSHCHSEIPPRSSRILRYTFQCMTRIATACSLPTPNIRRSHVPR